MKKIGIFAAAAALLTACTSPDSSDGGQGSKPIDPDQPEVRETLVPAPKAGTLYGTWIMVWNNSTESWFQPESIYGLKTAWPGELWKAPDWNDESYRKFTYDKLVEAGIDFMITDNTNHTLGKTDLIVQDYKKFHMPLKFCVGLGNKQLQGEPVRIWLEQIAKDPNYLKVNGLPVLVCYVPEKEWDNKYQHAIGDPLLAKFYRVWSSGENSRANKWGWQVEPEDGLLPSKQACFATPSVKVQERIDPATKSVNWSRSIAMMDFTFWQSRNFGPQFVIAGSYDDPAERNGWFPLDTREANEGFRDDGKFIPVTGIQMFDPWTGAIAEPYVFYDRMASWIKGEHFKAIPGGLLPDGVYRIQDLESGKYLQTLLDFKDKHLYLDKKNSHTFDEFVLYHLGENRYRIVNVYTGKPLRLDGEVLTTDDWTTAGNGEFRLEQRKAAATWKFEVLGTFAENGNDREVELVCGNGSLVSKTNLTPLK